MKYISRTKKKSTTTALILHPDRKKKREKKRSIHMTHTMLSVSLASVVFLVEKKNLLHYSQRERLKKG
jgi:hypothetical protein